MINQLKEIFPNLIYTDQNKTIPSTEYNWYLTPENEVIGIKKSDLTKKDQALLKLFLLPYSGAHPPVTRREKAWSKLIHERDQTVFYDQKINYRFILFTLSEPLLESTDFKEAIDGLYSNKPTILWIDQQMGMIIEEEQLDEEDISYDQMIEVFTTDFYLDVQFYIGPATDDLLIASEYFHWMEKSFAKINVFSIKSVMSYISAVPYLLPTMKDNHDVQFLIKAILKETIEDEELLRTIQTFLECNSNVSLAAKEMYMHRNSLQYRIDKFIEKTTIDVKQFEGALSVYLILLLKRHLEKNDSSN